MELRTIQPKNLSSNRFLEDVVTKDMLIIYGAGAYGRRLLHVIEKKGKRVDYFAVSDSTRVSDNIEGVPVVAIGDLSQHRESATVLVAVKDEDAQKEMLQILNELGFESVVTFGAKDIALFVADKWFVTEGDCYCACCGEKIGAFAIYLVGDAEWHDVRCPICGSAERHRGLWEYCCTEKIFEKEGLRVLHFAPEWGIYNKLSVMKNIDYYPVDIAPERYGYAIIRDSVDITAIPYEDNYFDVIICSHVLEHIGDERTALEELKRVLKPEGTAFIITPYESDMDTTLECEEYNTEELRMKYYGHPEHVRLNGQDYFDRVQDVGFVVERVKPFLVYEQNVLNYNGLDREEEIVICTKG